MSPELLLWIPPANKYYECGPQNIFEQCDGYSKTLVFSSCEMVPRVIATLTSYEAERLVNNRIGNKSIEQQSYYAVPESDEMDDDDIDTLVNIAIGSPAVCLYRDLEEIVDLEERKEIARECCDKSFVSMFNRPESRNIFWTVCLLVSARRYRYVLYGLSVGTLAGGREKSWIELWNVLLSIFVGRGREFRKKT